MIGSHIIQRTSFLRGLMVKPTALAQSRLLLGAFIGLLFTSSIAIAGPGNYRVIQDEAGKFWFADAQGQRFLSLGVNHIAGHVGANEGTPFYDGLKHQFAGDTEAWTASVKQILQRGGFNTVGAWSDPTLNGCGAYETVILYAAGWGQDRILDSLRPGFEQRVNKRVSEELSRWPDRSKVLGYFIDNEAAWFGRLPWVYEPTYTLLESALSRPADDTARHAAIDFLKERYDDDVTSFSHAWQLDPITSWDQITDAMLESVNTETANKDREAFIRHTAELYFKTTTTVIHELAPDALILGVRFANDAPDAVIEVCGKYCDVMSVNHYPHRPEVDKSKLARFWLLGGKPIMRTEFSWRGAENNSGNPNTRGAGAVVPTQQDRADNYQQYVEALLTEPIVIGAHWFEFADEPPQGRFDGEDSNYGIVDIQHKPYDVLLDAMSQTNKQADAIHANSSTAIPTDLLTSAPVTLFTGQYPDRPPRIGILAETPTAEPAVFNDTDASVTLTRRGKTLHITYDSGTGWGGGCAIFGPKRMAIEGGTAQSTDLAGYSKVTLVATMPKDFRFNLIVDEAAVASPADDYTHINTSDDGEAYHSVPLRGMGSKHRYTIDLTQLLPRGSWGNQQGNHRIDMQSLHALGLTWDGNQGAGVLTIHALILER